jgi:hypothetical protein
MKRVSLGLPPIPDDIKKLWGKPPLLSNEDEKSYDLLARRIAKALNPTDIIGWILVKGCLDATWDSFRLGLFKPMLTRLERDHCGEFHLSDEEQPERFFEHLDYWERVDRLVSEASARQMIFLREFDRRRAESARAQSGQGQPSAANDDSQVNNEAKALIPRAKAGGRVAAQAQLPRKTEQ